MTLTTYLSQRARWLKKHGDIRINLPHPSSVTLVEVGPRDGLQNEPNAIPTDIKIEFINRLSATGLSVIETTSFVSPQWVPQLADHYELFTGINKNPEIRYPVLVPNAQGAQQALDAGAKDISVFTTVSEHFSQKNTNCSISESLQRIDAIIALAKKHSTRIRAYISCVLGCPYEGAISEKAVAKLAKQLIEKGCDEISLGDTIGVGTPYQAHSLIQTVAKQVSIDRLAVHFHDTYGQALANITACLSAGIRIVDCSIGGLGGCPYAPGASGNVATQDVVYLLNGMGIKTGVDLDALNKVDQFIFNQLNRPTHSKVALALQSCSGS